MTRKLVLALALMAAVPTLGADIKVKDAKSSYTLRLVDGNFAVAVVSDAKGVITKIEVQVLPPGPVPDPPTPTPVPVPVPVPVPPPLQGLALEVFKACPQEPLANAKRLADNFKQVATMMKENPAMTFEQSRDEIHRLNGQSTQGGPWPDFGKWLGKLVATNSGNRDQLIATFEAISQGLEAKGTN